MSRVIRLPQGVRIEYDKLTPEQREKVDELLAEWERIVQANPFEKFEAHSEAQRQFLWAKTGIIAAQAGNRFGKTTMVVIRGGIECLDDEYVPSRLAGIKRFQPPCYGWILCPTEDKIEDTFKPAFRKWYPPSALLGGSVDKAWNGERNLLRFANGSHIALKTYKQAADTLESAAVHWVAYDEPPPREHREACMTRLIDYGGYEMFAYTPLKSNTGYVKREIYKRRASPDITFVQGSMHDNPMLDAKTKERVLGLYTNDLWRRAREFGDFVDLGGLIYEGFERCVKPEPWPGSFVKDLDVVVGIDPGIRNAAMIWVGFDGDLIAHVFAERLIQDGTPDDYAKAIEETNSRWGVKDPLYVIDPAARQRAQVNAETVQSALHRLGIHSVDGQNNIEAGVQQIRSRMQHGRFWVSPECVGLRDEADDYVAEDREDGVFKPVKGNDHRLDALRYACMARPWFVESEIEEPKRNLDWQPGVAPAIGELTPALAVGPMGSMS